jgi:hypothetical protein
MSHLNDKDAQMSHLNDKNAQWTWETIKFYNYTQIRVKE